MKYKIGEEVKRKSDDATCIVIATKDNPHKIRNEDGVLTGELLEVPDDNDYLVVSKHEITSDNRFSPYYPIKNGDIDSAN